MTEADLTSLKEVVEGRLTLDRPMADLSWLRVGGEADLFFQPAHMADIAAFLKALPTDVPVMPIGVCSNLIIRDGGIRGAVIHPVRGEFGEVTVEGELLIAGAGARFKKVASVAEAAGLAVDNGIVVDAHCRTSDPSIYSAGDCAVFEHLDLPTRLVSRAHRVQLQGNGSQQRPTRNHSLSLQ